MPALYIVGTPIGNLEDMSFRAVRVLKEVDLIASEDTRTTRRLLSHFDIHTPLTSYFEHSKATKLNALLDRLEKEDIALVSEAGMPAISDPGYELVVAAASRGIAVIPITGPSAAVTALAVSGLPTDRFHYLGFLPRQGSERRKVLQEAKGETATLIAYEAPHRLIKALQDILSILGNRPIAVGRELTKLHEEVFRGSVQQAIEHFGEPRGEFTLVIGGCPAAKTGISQDDIAARIKELRRAGKGAREAVSELSEASGLPRKELYKMWLDAK
jgi:16S rRNA (cytidine1402-2'-O)-methyltransferase